MSRKQVHNAYYFFMLEFQEKSVGKYKSLKEVAEAASPHWKKLGKEQRKVYEDMAQAAKSEGRMSKLNSDKQCIDEIEETERKEWEAKQEMKDEILSNLEMIKRTSGITSHVFFIIHMNSFCQHDHTKEYSPCEVGIAGFSLENGVLEENIYHSMINPGSLPLGYANIAQQHANETHQIELPKYNDPESENQEAVFKDILKFLSTKNRLSSERLPILYAAHKNLPMVADVIQTWCERFGFSGDLFRIYELQFFFRSLRNIVAGYECWTSDTMSHQEVERDVYNYTEEIACEFHQMADALNFCARSISIRYAYVICDNCCKDANIELIPGCHVPSKAKIAHDKAAFTPAKSSKKKSTKYSSETSLRGDTSETETVVSVEKYSLWEETSSALSDFPELERSAKQHALSEYSNVPAGSYAGAMSYSGFSRRPPTLPPTVIEGMTSMSLDSESRDQHFPPIGRGKPGSSGRGRGNPFMKPAKR